MVEGKKIGNLSWQIEEGVGDTIPGFMAAQKGKTGNKITPEKILKLRGNRDFVGYIREKYGDCDGARIKFCYGAVTSLQLDQFLRGPMSENERDSLFFPINGSSGKGSYFSIDPRKEAWYSNEGSKILVKVIIYMGDEDHLLDNSEFCLRSTADCYPTHIIYLRQTSGMRELAGTNLLKNFGYKMLGMVSNRWKRNIPNEKIEREPESESEPEESKVVRTIKLEPNKIKGVETKKSESGESKVVEESKVVRTSKPEPEKIKLVERKKPEPEEIKLAEPKKPEAEKSKVVVPPKRKYDSPKDIVSKDEHPVWSVKVEGGEMMEYNRKQSEETETIYQRWQHSPNTQDWKNNKGKLSKEGKWTYEISFKEYNPNSWTQKNTTTKKKRIIWRGIMCHLVDAKKVPTLLYRWYFKEQEGVYIEYYHIHQVEIEDIFQSWRAGGCGRGNLSRDMGGNVKQNYFVEFASSDKSTWKQSNLETGYSRCLRREPDIDVSERVYKEPNIQLLEADSPKFKEVRDQFMSAQTHGDLMEVGSIWKIKKVAGDLAFMENLKSNMLEGEANTNIKTLYHGSTKKNIKSIIFETDKTGFLMSKGGKLGSGVYFSADPGKTKYYSKDNQDFLLIAIVNLKGCEYLKDKIYDEYCVTNESLAMPTHIIRYNIKCRLCGLFINNGDNKRTQEGGVHIVHTSCWQKKG